MINTLMKKDLKPASGFDEYTPNEQVYFDQALSIVRKQYEMVGAVPIETPLIENKNILLTKEGAEDQSIIYGIRHLSGNEALSNLGIRFDHTLPLMRYVSRFKRNIITFPFLRYSIGSVLRGEKTSYGRSRQFYQCDVDKIGMGSLSLVSDAEIISLIYRSISALLPSVGFSIHISNYMIINSILNHLNVSDKDEKKEILLHFNTFIKTEKVSEYDIVANLSKGLKEAKDNFEILEFLENFDIRKFKMSEENTSKFNLGVRDLGLILSLVRNFGVPEDFLFCNLSIKRDLGYYTGVVFETYLNKGEVKKYTSYFKSKSKNINKMHKLSVASGGRYENLLPSSNDRNKYPGVGMSIGLTRLFTIIKDIDSSLSLFSTISPNITSVIIITKNPSLIEYSVKIASRLRNNGISSYLFSEDKSIKNQLKFAKRKGYKVAVVLTDRYLTDGLIEVNKISVNKKTMVSSNILIDTVNSYLINYS